MLSLFHYENQVFRIEIFVRKISETAGNEGMQSGTDSRAAINFIMLREF